MQAVAGGREQRVKRGEENQKPKTQARECFQKEWEANSTKCCQETWTGLSLSDVHGVW